MNKGVNDRDQEIHSEKVSKLLDEFPSQLEKCGWVIILTIFLALLLVVCFVPYPYSN